MEKTAKKVAILNNVSVLPLKFYELRTQGKINFNILMSQIISVSKSYPGDMEDIQGTAGTAV